MKKTLTILTLVVMLAAMIVPVAMAVVDATAACDHPGVYIATEETVFKSYSNTQHGYATHRIAKCTACNATLSDTYANWYGLAPHVDSGAWTDMGHVSGTATHKFKTKCSACSGNYTFTKSCKGPPCPAY